MKKTLLILLIITSILKSNAQRPWMQATIKPGLTPRTVDIYLKSSTSFTQKDEAMTVVLAVPSTVTPAPSVATQTGLGSAGVTANGLGVVSAISGLQPAILINNLGSTSREVVVNNQIINGVPYYLYTFIFANTAILDHIWVAGVEQLIFSIQFNGCLTNCTNGSILLVNLPNGGSSARDYFYFQANFLQDVTNSQEPFYQNPSSTAPINGGSYSALSLIGLVAPISLPIKLTAFDAKADDCTVSVNWTASEESSSGSYDVEASRDGTTFTKLTKITAAAQDGIKSYLYEDKAAEAGKNFYRLRIMQKDGSFTYSSIKEVNLKCSGKGGVTVFPTITKGPVKIMLTSGTENAIIRVYNSTGQQVLTNNSKSQSRSIDLSSFARGTYLVNIYNNDKIITTKIIKQ